MKLPWNGDTTRRNGRSRARSLPDSGASREASSEDLASLAPGDAISFWGEGNRLVSCVFDCGEGIGEQRYTWHWIFLDDGSLVESSADGWWRYTEHEILPQGSPRYAALVGRDGALEQFEARVRNDTVHDDPVLVQLQGRPFRVTSTGTVEVARHGEPPRLSPWQRFVPKAEENVYFSLVCTEDEEVGALGIWTSHVCLSFGRPISQSDVDGIYHRA
jgi:hypothetical protein